MAYTLILSASSSTLFDACAEADRCLMKATWYPGHLLHLPATIKSLPFLLPSYYLMKWVAKELESQSKLHSCSSIIVKKYLFSDGYCFFPDMFMYMINLFITLLPYVYYRFPYLGSIVQLLHPILLSDPSPLSRGLLTQNILLIVFFEIHVT